MQSGMLLVLFHFTHKFGERYNTFGLHLSHWALTIAMIFKREYVVILTLSNYLLLSLSLSKVSFFDCNGLTSQCDRAIGISLEANIDKIRELTS